MVIKLIKPTYERTIYYLIHGLTGTFFIFLAQYIYSSHSYYQGFLSERTADALSTLLTVVLIILWIDTLLKYLFSSKLEKTTLTNIYFYLFTNIRNLINKLIHRKLVLAVKWTPEIKTSFLFLLVKFFFVPIMLNTVVHNGSALISDIGKLNAGTLTMDFDLFFDMAVTFLFFIDTAIFTFGYLFASKFLRSNIRSVEPTLFGWFIALSTYPPFNSVTGQIFPLIRDSSTILNENDITLRVIQLLILLCHIVFVYASVALGTKASNLTNRGIICRGPYKVVRHPAYVAKLSGWFFYGLLYAGSISYFFYLIPYMVIYGLRALTEEWHLNADPDYLAYKEKVKWRFVPGVV